MKTKTKTTSKTRNNTDQQWFDAEIAKINAEYWSEHMVDFESHVYRTAVTGFLIRRHWIGIIRSIPGKTLLSLKSIKNALSQLGANDVTPGGKRIVDLDTIYVVLGHAGWDLPAKFIRDKPYFDLSYIDATPADRSLYAQNLFFDPKVTYA